MRVQGTEVSAVLAVRAGVTVAAIDCRGLQDWAVTDACSGGYWVGTL